MAKKLVDQDLRARAVNILVKELGYPDAVRFIVDCSRSKGDYTKERRTLLKGVTVEQLLSEGDRFLAQERTKRRRRSA